MANDAAVAQLLQAAVLLRDTRLQLARMLITAQPPADNEMFESLMRADQEAWESFLQAVNDYSPADASELPAEVLRVLA